MLFTRGAIAAGDVAVIGAAADIGCVAAAGVFAVVCRGVVGGGVGVAVVSVVVGRVAVALDGSIYDAVDANISDINDTATAATVPAAAFVDCC